MIWYYYANGKERLGPIDDTEFQRLSQENIIRGDTLVWRDGMAGWQPRSTVAVGGGMVCAACGRAVSDAESFALGGHSYCAVCKPLIMERIQEGKGLPVGGAEELRSAHIKHEASVKSIGVLYYLGGVAMVCMAGSSFVRAFTGRHEPSVWLVVGAIYIGIAIMEFVVGTGIRRLRPWSRICVGIISGLGLLAFPIGTIINAYVLYLVFSKKGTMLFTPEYHAAIASTPHIRYRTSILVWVLLGIVLLFILLGISAAIFSHH